MKIRSFLFISLLLNPLPVLSQEADDSKVYQPETYQCALTVEQNGVDPQLGRMYVHLDFEVEYPHITQEKDFSFTKEWSAQEVEYEINTEQPEKFNLRETLQKIQVTIKNVPLQSQHFAAEVTLQPSCENESLECAGYSLSTRASGGSAIWYRSMRKGGPIVRNEDFFASRVSSVAQVETNEAQQSAVKQPWLMLSCQLKSPSFATESK